ADKYFNLFYLLLLLVALVLAHASNNLINDYFDYKQGIDTPDYHRTQYSPHPIASGLMTEKELLIAFFLFSLIELAIAIYLTLKCGLPVLIFAIIGFLLSIFYVAPPLKLKYRGLGELAIFFIWGPMITVGTYYVMAGNMPLHTWLVSIPYGLVVTNVLFGKHLDKYEKDREKRVLTLPVLLGWKNAILFAKINAAFFYITVILLVLFKIVTPFTLLTFFSINRFRFFLSILDTPKPNEKPKDFIDIWPLWYVAWAFWFNKLAGGLFILGLVLGIIFNLFIKI
ncbi:MAG: prenyltransferase, partial [Candidatus Goldbacteria bacterium]|nr:prenyltransferase [Candidatus Goldiibacteriota bacterium]